MDELELLKKDWKTRETKYPKVSYDDIYKMILKKSSSIVKWIFIISLLEFVFWALISFAFKDSESVKRFESLGVDNIILVLSVMGYLVLGYFFYLFYRNYKRISVTDSAKILMENILKTRRTVKQYVGFNLGYLVLTSIIFIFIEFKKDPLLINQVNSAAADGETFKFYASFIIITVLMLAIVVGLLLGFYWLIYGVLLKRLNVNYKELKKLEI